MVVTGIDGIFPHHAHVLGGGRYSLFFHDALSYLGIWFSLGQFFASNVWDSGHVVQEPNLVATTAGLGVVLGGAVILTVIASVVMPATGKFKTFSSSKN